MKRLLMMVLNDEYGAYCSELKPDHEYVIKFENDNWVCSASEQKKPSAAEAAEDRIYGCAAMLARQFGDAPCVLYDMNDFTKSDEWCDKNCTKATTNDCWVHAIKEGWLNRNMEEINNA